MKTPNVGRTFSAALTALALAAATQIAYAAGGIAGENQSAGHAAAGPTPAVAVAVPRPAGQGPAVTLYVQDPSGKALQLVYVEGTGWKYGAPKSQAHAGGSLFRKIAFRSPPAASTNDVAQDDEALTVFIDGPSGFTYVWTRDGGWKFVGTLTDRH